MFKSLYFKLQEDWYTLYLFTKSDFIFVLMPQTLFCLFSGLSGQLHGSDTAPAPSSLLLRLPYIVGWIWLNLLVLDLANQRLPGSVAEDAINKPWRPIPSKRISQNGARQLLILSIVATFLVSLFLGRTEETLVLFVLNWIYNDLGLANEHWFLRNVLSALGMTCIGVGATQIGYGTGAVLKHVVAYPWWILCAAVLLTTIQVQDLHDQEGDATRGRSTAPLVFGDAIARWSVALPVLGWSLVLPAWMGMSGWKGYLLPVAIGAVVAGRVLLLHGVGNDKRTFQTWAVWMVALYALPLIKTAAWD